MRKLIAPLRSPALLSAVTFAAGGVGFAVGNILLARVLPADEYGTVALVLAVTQLGITLGPLGLETLINRHHLAASLGLLKRSLLTSTVVAAALALLVVAIYAVSAPVAVALAVTVIAAALNRIAGAFLQSRRRFAWASGVLLVHNWVVLCAVPVVLLFDRRAALPAVLTTTFGYLLMATVGWRYSLRTQTGSDESPPKATLLHEGLAAVSSHLAISLLYQLDRLLIPRVLSIADLATYSVVAAIAASPFRMLQVGVSFTLVPRLRAAPSRAAIRRLMRHEIAVVFGIAVLASIGVLVVMPWVGEHFLQGRYVFARDLLYAMVIVGFVRVWSGFASASVMALGSTRELVIYNGWSWVALGFAAAGATVAARYGLTGIVYGLGIGWFTLALAATAIANRACGRRPASVAPR